MAKIEKAIHDEDIQEMKESMEGLIDSLKMPQGLKPMHTYYWIGAASPATVFRYKERTLRKERIARTEVIQNGPA